MPFLLKSTDCTLQWVHGQLRSPVSETHCPRRVPWDSVHDAHSRPGDAIFSFSAPTELPLLCGHKKNFDILLHENLKNFLMLLSVFQKLTHWFSHGHSLSSWWKNNKTDDLWNALKQEFGSLVTKQCKIYAEKLYKVKNKQSFLPHCLMAQ